MSGVGLRGTRRETGTYHEGTYLLLLYGARDTQVSFKCTRAQEDAGPLRADASYAEGMLSRRAPEGLI